MDSFRFSHPEALYLLILVPVILLLIFLFSRQRKSALKRFGESHLISHLMQDYSSRRVHVKTWLFMLAFTLQIIVVAGPQFGSRLQTVQRNGIEIMVAIDVSNSMNAQDIQPSRMEMAKMAVSRLIDKIKDDRLGIAVFAAKSYIQLPITSDYPSAKMFLDQINTGMVNAQGTAIGDAIALCQRSFSPAEGVNRAIVIFTDGENHEDDAVLAAAEAQREGTRVFVVGMGTTKGAPIPVTPGSSSNFMKDKDGNVVITKIDEQMMMQVAQAGGGAYIPANNIRNGINNLVAELSTIEKSEFEARVYSDYEDRAVYVEMVVLLLLVLDMLLLSRKNPRLAQFDIFTRKKTSKDMFIAEKI